MGTIIVAVLLNLVAALILLSNILTASGNSWKLTLAKFVLVLSFGVGTYFVTPVLAEAIGNIDAQGVLIKDTITNLGISVLTFNAVIFTLIFILSCSIIGIASSLIRHSLVKSLKNTSGNVAKLKRARSINAKAERLVRRQEWRQLNSEYKDDLTWYSKLISIILSVISGLVIGLIVLMPFGYIAEDLNKAAGGDKAFLEEGFDYTLNGVIDEKIEFKVFDWLISAEQTPVDPEAPVCEHSFVEGVCEHCGEAEIPAEVPCEHTFVDGVCSICGDPEVPAVE